MCTTCCPGRHYVDQVDFRLTDTHLALSGIKDICTGIKTCTNMLGRSYILNISDKQFRSVTHCLDVYNPVNPAAALAE